MSFSVGIHRNIKGTRHTLAPVKRKKDELQVYLHKVRKNLFINFLPLPLQLRLKGKKRKKKKESKQRPGELAPW